MKERKRPGRGKGREEKVSNCNAIMNMYINMLAKGMMSLSYELHDKQAIQLPVLYSCKRRESTRETPPIIK